MGRKLTLTGTKLTDTTAPLLVSLIAADSFTRADGTALGATETGGYTWTIDGSSGTPAISSNRLSLPSTGSSWEGAGVIIKPGIQDGAMEVTLTQIGELCGLYARAGSSSGYIFAASYSNYVLRRRDAYNTQTVLTSGGPAPTAGARLRLEIKNGTITGYVNGTQVVTAADNTLSGSGWGVYNVKQTAIFDDFRLTNA